MSELIMNTASIAKMAATEVKVPTESYDSFQANNTGEGTLKIRVTTAREALPVAGANVSVTKEFTDGRVEFFSGTTDADGVVRDIPLASPERSLTLDPYGVRAYAVYSVAVSHPDYEAQYFNDVVIFENVKSVLPVSMNIK